MRQIRKTTIILVAGVLIAAGSVLGGPLLNTQVSSTANWVVHADYDRFRSTQIGQLITDELEILGIAEKLRNFASVFSFNPLNDIRGVTLYGSGADKQKAVVIIDGNFDKDKLVSLVSMNPEYEQLEYGGITVHRWADENKRKPDGTAEKMYGCFYGEKLMVLSTGLDAITQAIDVLRGKAACAESNSPGPAGVSGNTAFLQVAARAIDKIAEQEPKAAMLKQADELAIVIGETQGSFYIDVGLKAKSEEAAENIRKMADGLIAFANLAGQEQPKLAELAAKLQLSRTENAVRLRFESNSQDVFDFLKEQWKIKVETKQ